VSDSADPVISVNDGNSKSWASQWYCPITSARVTPTSQRRPSTAQWCLSIFSYSDQFLCDFAMDDPVYDGSANSGSFHK
jgi:hypothetical protein